jgi:hypothetical protein
MKLSVIAVLAVLAFGSWFILRARAKNAHGGDQPIVANLSNKDPADAGKDLRRMMLTIPPQDLGVSPQRNSHGFTAF